MALKDNYEYFMSSNIDNYIGKWIAICDKKIVSSGEDIKKVYSEAKSKYPKSRPLITKVPDKETMIF